ncbi:MAG TPA: amino acid ABC transporter permease [Planctomycetota bacterium]|nr:amino acid ABC transporter permease [Planctomycetota bacterium]
MEYLIKDLALPELLAASRYTIYLTALSMPLALIVGLILALMRMSRHRWLSWPAAIYIEAVRGTPLIVQVFLVYFSLPVVGRWLNTDFFTLEKFTVGVICLAGNYAAYEAEIHRAGLQAIDKGQREAALSIGLSDAQAFRFVVLPQAFRIVVPPVINDLIAMLKDSSIVSVIGLEDLLNEAQSIGRSHFTVPRMLVMAAVIYLILSLICFAFGRWVEKKLKVRGGPELHIDNVHGH